MATVRRRLRACNYCPHPGADCCVRVAPDGKHVYAHRACAEDRGISPMYVFTHEAPRAGVGQ